MKNSVSPSASAAGLAVHRVGGELEVAVSGDWKHAPRIPGLEELSAQLDGAEAPSAVRFTAEELGTWDSRLLAVTLRVMELVEGRGRVEIGGLPEGLRKLVALARAVPEKADARRMARRPAVLERIGEVTLAGMTAGREVLTFLGDCVLGFFKLVRGKAQFRWPDMFLVMQQTGADALPIVALISLLVGMILGFVGAVQLARFGASIYLADLVGIAMAREMGAMMTGIIMAGRTGAAFAAQLGTMKVNEEIDAYRALGISPIEFLVLPRMLALFAMMPLLVVFADLVGIVGGLLVALAMVDMSVGEYWKATVVAVTLPTFLLGIVKGSCFGVLVAVTGCLRGMQCGSNAAAVGQATTSAVVLGITSIIVADALFAVLTNILGI